MTVISLALWGASIYVSREVDTWLASIAAEAMKRADLTQDYVSRVTRITPARLSDQLSGKLPFTGLVRFGCEEIRLHTDFWTEFADVLAARVNCALVPRDLGSLLAGVEELVGMKRRMAKAPQAAPGSCTVTVTLPLGQKESA